LKSIASVPGKIIFAGEHFVVHGTKSILFSINKRVTVISELQHKKISIKSNACNITTDNLIEDINPTLKPFIHIINLIFKKHSYHGGIKVTIDSDIPIGVGLGSSSACCVAIAASVSNLFKKITKKDIIDLAVNGEKTIFKNTSGADCTICTYGGIIEYDKKSGYRKIDINKNICLIVINSMIKHSTDIVVKHVLQFKKNHEAYFKKLCDMESRLIERLKLDLMNNDIISMGIQMNTNQRYLEEIGASNNIINDMIKKMKNISYGSKITGAGGGGCIIVLTDKNNTQKIINTVGTKYSCFRICNEFNGLTTSIK